MPPDVRRGSAPPEAVKKNKGLCPGSGSARLVWAKGRTRGIAHSVFGLFRRGVAPPHIRRGVAVPVQELLRQGRLMTGLAETLTLLSRRQWAGTLTHLTNGYIDRLS